MKKQISLKELHKIPLSQILIEKPLPCSLYVYLPKNKKIVLLFKKQETFSKKNLEHFQKKNFQSLWIPKKDLSLWKAFLNSHKNALSSSLSSSSTNPSTLSPVGSKTSDSTHAASIQNQKKTKITATQKTKKSSHNITTPISSTIAENVPSATTPTPTVMRVLENSFQKNAFFKDSNKQSPKMIFFSQLSHCIEVAHFAGMFSLAFGKINQTLTSDLVLAALIHDVGLSQLSHQEIYQAEKEKTPSISYENHVQFSLDIIQTWGTPLPERVLELVSQHHERFNGKGFPNRLKGFEFDEASQVLSLADRVDLIQKGLWDGTTHSLEETFYILQGLETELHFPQFFHPDVFEPILKWLQTPAPLKQFSSIQIMIKDHLKTITGMDF